MIQLLMLACIWQRPLILHQYNSMLLPNCYSTVNVSSGDMNVMWMSKYVLNKLHYLIQINTSGFQISMILWHISLMFEILMTVIFISKLSSEMSSVPNTISEFISIYICYPFMFFPNNYSKLNVSNTELQFLCMYLCVLNMLFYFNNLIRTNSLGYEITTKLWHISLIL